MNTMYVRLKLTQILRRVNLLSKTLPLDGEYKKGFEHATNLTTVAIRQELQGFVQVSYNKDLEIAQLKRELKEAKGSKDRQRNHVATLEKTVSDLAARDISSRKVKGICRIMAAMTGQPYDYIKKEFTGYLEGSVKLIPEDYE